MLFIAEGYQPDCDGPVRWLESVHADDIEGARLAVMPEYNSSGDLCPDAVYSLSDALAKWPEQVNAMLAWGPLGWKLGNGPSSCEENDPGARPFYYASLNR